MHVLFYFLKKEKVIYKIILQKDTGEVERGKKDEQQLFDFRRGQTGEGRSACA